MRQFALDDSVHVLSLAGDGTLHAAGSAFHCVTSEGILRSCTPLASPWTLIAIDHDGTVVSGTKDGQLHAR